MRERPLVCIRLVSTRALGYVSARREGGRSRRALRPQLSAVNFAASTYDRGGTGRFLCSFIYLFNVFM